MLISDAIFQALSQLSMKSIHLPDQVHIPCLTVVTLFYYLGHHSFFRENIPQLKYEVPSQLPMSTLFGGDISRWSVGAA